MTTANVPAGGWRVMDIVVAAVLAVAFGVVFQVWNILWETTTFVFPPLRGAIYGMWMVPAVLVPLVVRRPGAALFAEVVAASASMLFGAQWGLLTVLYGLVQGAAAELVFAFGLYRSWSLPVAMLAGAAAGIGGALLDLPLFYSEIFDGENWGVDWQVLYVGIVAVSAALIAGLGSWLLVRALARTGVLSGFPAGADQPEV
jgi:energy-coupling factor transport system substrate-specific component